jgi:tetratricopeptide (TPR) repeat protein
MGFGMRTDYATGRSLDLDKSYTHLVRPAVEDAGLECVRADEVIHSGTIDGPLYRFLLEAEVVVVDLSTSNPNAIYELGVRHALRPQSTIVMAERRFLLPFDLGPIEMLRYEHSGRGLDVEEVERVRRQLKDTILSRVEATTADSPVHIFLPGLHPANVPTPPPQGKVSPLSPAISTTEKTCYVAMGFGMKTDYATARTLDLDKTYRFIIKPAVASAGLACVRADEVAHAGNINIPMFDQLSSADVVVADLSTSNPNALYELGVRHGLRPHTTIVIAERQFRFPFDIAHMAVMAYEHLGEGIDFAEVERMRAQLTERIKAAVETPRTDSPVFMFLPDLPAITRAAGERNAEQAEDPEVKALIEMLDQAKKQANWIEAQRYAERLLQRRPADPYLKQQLALATFRSKQPDALTALARAKEILLGLNPRETRDSETLGLWAAVHQRLWELSHQQSDLDDAIAAFEKGFGMKDDYYNGTNLAFLLIVRATVSGHLERDAIADAEAARRVYRRVVALCDDLERRGAEREDGSASEEAFWVKAALAEALVGVGETARATRMQEELRTEALADWMKEAVANRIQRLEGLLAKLPRLPS